jgi:hypothetical protein
MQLRGIKLCFLGPNPETLMSESTASSSELTNLFGNITR